MIGTAYALESSKQWLYLLIACADEQEHKNRRRERKKRVKRNDVGTFLISTISLNCI